MHSHRRLLALGAAVAVTAALTQVVPGVGADGAAPTVSAKPTSGSKVDPKLGNGLGRLVAQKQSGKSPGGLKIDQGSLAIRDKAGRVLINLTPADGTGVAAYKQRIADLGFELTATDQGTGTLEGYAPLGKMTKLASLSGTGTIVQALRPTTYAGETGDAVSQGVEFQKAGKVLRRGLADGSGITVGVLSDSYNTSNTDLGGAPEIKTHAEDDVLACDLPGAGNPCGDEQPVVVLDEYAGNPDSSTDEGRAMLQIVHDMAPKAKLCFASAFNGDVSFADNIRDLADPEGLCGADVIVDDVSYFNEPFFSDGIIGDAVDDVTADGVSYFSSAGNAGDQNAWRSKVRLLTGDDATAQADKAGLDFSEVDPSLYAGGLQDMKPGIGTDVAQTLSIGPSGGLYDMQWSDPVDLDGPTLGDPLYTNSGVLTEANSEEGQDFTYTVDPDDVGQLAQFRADGDPSGSVDLILTITEPDGTELDPVDTGASPEVEPLTLEEGDYNINVSGFEGDMGPFDVDVSPIEEASKVTTDFNILLFDADGNYLGAAGDDNVLTGRPSEVLSIPGVLEGDVQLVIADSTPGPTNVQEIGYINNDEVYTKEYFDPLAPATFGHHIANGNTGVAAIDPFKPYVNEYYTSPGGALNLYYDSQGNPLTGGTQVRMKPEIASTDRGNTSFFVADDLRDDDSFPNFGGTSAAAPHAAAIAALMIDAAGGPGSLTPGKVRRTMTKTAFNHDLDPFEASGKKKQLKVSAVGAPGDERDATPASMDDPNFFRISYDGNNPISRIEFHAADASPTSLGASPEDGPAGLVFDNRPLAGPGQYRNGGFPFTTGVVAGGLKDSQISAQALSKIDGEPYFQTLRVKFSKEFKKGQAFTFGIDRDIRFPGLADHPVEGNGADEIGGGVLLPQDKVIEGGMTFTAFRKGAPKIEGQVVNNLGHGFSALDGYGVANALAAVEAVQQ